MTPRQLLVIASIAALAVRASAQESVATTGFTPASRPGWTLTPGFGVSETYDDNISMFGVRTAEESNNDVIATYSPSADLRYTGKHSDFAAGYAGSFLAYRTFSGLNSWDQRGRITMKRQESERLRWFLVGNAAAVPTTDAVDLGGIPFRRAGATIANASSTVDYRVDARNDISGSFGLQYVKFDITTELPGGFEQGGRTIDATGGWRHHVSARLAAGADYGIRRAITIGGTTAFTIHSVEGAADYEVSPSWSLSGAAGVVVLQQTLDTQGRTGPAWQFTAMRHGSSITMQVSYLQSYVPSFAFGGTIKSQELGFGMHAPLFHSRYWYTDQTAMFRDDQPLTNLVNQLPLRSLRTNSVIGWTPQPWVRIEGFYARIQQSTLQFGGQMYRNRIGFNIVTSKPVRIE